MKCPKAVAIAVPVFFHILILFLAFYLTESVFKLPKNTTNTNVPTALPTRFPTTKSPVIG